MEPFSFPSLFVSSARMRGTVHSTAGIGYYLLAWHIHEHTHTKARMQRLTHTHTHSGNKLGESALHAGMWGTCVCVFYVWMTELREWKREAEKERGKKDKEKTKTEGKRETDFWDADCAWPRVSRPTRLKTLFSLFFLSFISQHAFPFFSSSTHSFPSSSILFFRPLLHPWSFSLRVAVDETVRMEGPWVGVGVLLHRWRQGITERQRGEVKSLLILSCCQMVGWW